MDESTDSRAAALGATPGRGGRLLLALSRYMAITGGLVFLGIVIMEIVSIVGRKLFSWPVPGDVELLQMCAAFASAAFFAYCHMVRGDVKVDFFTHNLRADRVAMLDAFGSLLVGLFGALIAWRAGAGALTVKEAGETSAILEIPVWIAQALMVPGFLLLAAAGFYQFVHLTRAALLHRARQRPEAR
ncbi:MAG TPA: TRAP transporter small permease [Casimicrobiaceae bacterium]|nr:TRAP transporter small permease [Casimicrobiaceae bacterium]